MGEPPGLSGWSLWEGGGRVRVRGHLTMEAVVRVMTLLEGGHESKKPLEAGKGNEMDPPLDLQKEQSPADPFWTSDPRNCKRLHSCCFRPLTLGQLVIAAMKN